MKDEIISLETAKLAKDKGFNIRCRHFYNEGSGWKVQSDLLLRTGKDVIVEAPTQSLLQKWLREVQNLHIYIDTTPVFDKLQGSKYKSQIKTPFQPFKWTTGHYYVSNTYEESLEKGLQEALKIIK